MSAQLVLSVWHDLTRQSDSKNDLKAANFPLTNLFWYSLPGPTITWECRLWELRHIVSEKQKAFSLSTVARFCYSHLNGWTPTQTKLVALFTFSPLFSCVLTYSLQSQWNRSISSLKFRAINFGILCAISSFISDCTLPTLCTIESFTE